LAAETSPAPSAAKPQAAPAVTRSPFDLKDLSSYPGAYWSDELETQYTIVLKGDRLTAEHAHHGEIPLTPRAKDEFTGGAWFMPEVKFLRDGGGKVSALTLGGNRVTAIRFVLR
jgi:hypothetical protein